MASTGDGCPSIAGKPGGPAPEFVMQVKRIQEGPAPGPPHTLDQCGQMPQALLTVA